MPKSKDVLIGQAETIPALIRRLRTAGEVMKESGDEFFEPLGTHYLLIADDIERAQAAALPDVQPDQGAAIAENALQAPAIPAGYKLVPVEPVGYFSFSRIAMPGNDWVYMGKDKASGDSAYMRLKPFTNSYDLPVALFAAAPTPAPGDGWISVADGSPELETVVLAAWKGEMALAKLIRPGEWWSADPDEDTDYTTPLYWHKIPPPPEKDTKP